MLFLPHLPRTYVLQPRTVIVMLTGRCLKALEIYEPRVQAKVDLLMSKIAAANNDPIDVTKYFMYFSFDAMADVGK